METKSTQQEILLFTNTRFSSRQWTEKDETGKDNRSSREKLEEACWNGLIWQILPEICEKPNDISMTLWEINVANSFFDLNFSEFPRDIEKEFSIDPYKFLDIQGRN